MGQILTLGLQNFGHKLYHNNLPTPISKGMEKICNTSSGWKAHRYGTRLKSLPNLLPHRTQDLIKVSYAKQLHLLLNFLLILKI